MPIPLFRLSDVPYMVLSILRQYVTCMHFVLVKTKHKILYLFFSVLQSTFTVSPRGLQPDVTLLFSFL